LTISGIAGANRSENVKVLAWWTAANEAEIPTEATATKAITKTRRRMFASCLSPRPRVGVALFQDGFVGAENDFTQAAVIEFGSLSLRR
jgi:hypothetical protein